MYRLYTCKCSALYSECSHNTGVVKLNHHFDHGHFFFSFFLFKCSLPLKSFFMLLCALKLKTKKNLKISI